MKKKHIFILVIILTIALSMFMTACRENNEDAQDNSSNKTEETSPEAVSEKSTSDEESAPADYKEKYSTSEAIEKGIYKCFDEFPNVIDIVSYLGLNPDYVNMISSNGKEVAFSFYEDSFSDTSKPNTYSYAKLLESEGYKLKLYDGTVASTSVLENDNYSIEITYLTNDKSEREKYIKEIENDESIDLDSNNLECIKKMTPHENVLFRLKNNN